jgi:hypothetical protein
LQMKTRRSCITRCGAAKRGSRYIREGGAAPGARGGTRRRRRHGETTRRRVAEAIAHVQCKVPWRRVQSAAHVGVAGVAHPLPVAIPGECTTSISGVLGRARVQCLGGASCLWPWLSRWGRMWPRLCWSGRRSIVHGIARAGIIAEVRGLAARDLPEEYVVSLGGDFPGEGIRPSSQEAVCRCTTQGTCLESTEGARIP